jgi:antitoxin component YwqK of YwqJK toxin-antitoxin module
MRKDITPFNKQGQPHGWWEEYWPDGQLMLKGNYIYGKKDGFWKFYFPEGQLWYQGNYINEKEDGCWIENDYKKINFYL